MAPRIHKADCLSRMTWLNEATGQQELCGLSCDCEKPAMFVALLPVPESADGRLLQRA